MFVLGRPFQSSLMFAGQARVEGATTLSITTLSITTFSITTLSIKTLSIMELVTTLSINNTQHRHAS